ncbi:Endoribonuclease L-PSP [Entamoeba marina]
MSKFEIVASPNAPEAVGPYCQAIKCNGMLYASGQIGIDRQTGKMVDNTVEGQTQQALKNMKYVLEEAGTSMGNVVKCICLLKDINDFGAFNKIYAEAFGDHKPARACYQAGALPVGALVEIEYTAVL